jgi:sulfoxide reductase heme-binding subunit YedZ
MLRSRLSRHLLLGTIAVSTTGGLYAAVPHDSPVVAATDASAYSALAFLSVALLIGPALVLRGRRPPRHVEWRRDIGIWAGILSLFHVLAGANVHFAGDWVRYFLTRAEEGARVPIRVDAFGIANHLGLFATIVVVLLLVISNNAAMRKMGGVRWKAAQRATYALFILTGAHGVLYQVLSERRIEGVILLWLALVTVTLAQVAGFRRVRVGRADTE